MSAIIAHELRQPLSSISGFAHGIQRLMETHGTLDRNRISQGVDMLQKQAEKAERIVRKVREYAKGKGAKRQVLELNRVVSNAVETINASKTFAIQARVEASQGSALIFADPLEVELCVINLVKNALEAVSSDSGQVSVVVERRGDRALVCVRDNGPSLSEEAFEALRRPLSSSKFDGLGLGLSIVSLIVESHGGRLSFERSFPQGLIATLSLPLQTGANPVEPPCASAPADSDR